jgi:pyruvate kinase
MLSAETSIGKYPVEATSIMSRISKETEPFLPYERIMVERAADLEPQTDEAIAYDACRTAYQLHTPAILAFTESGGTAWRVSRYRPWTPILALTPSYIVRRRLTLAWGVYPYIFSPPTHIDEFFQNGSTIAKELGAAKEGDLVIITGGIPIGIAGTTNLLKVEKV